MIPAMSFTARILAGLGLGTVVGLWLGERAVPLRLVADAFVRLLEMTVLPYLTVSLVAGIGSLDYARAKSLFLRGGAITLVLWALALGVVLAMPLAFPAIQTASFFSTTLVSDRAPVDLVSLYVPSNPFHSLANSVVPAVVVFSVVVGAALMGAPRKERLLETLNVLEETLARANRFLIRLTPIGVFAIAAHFAGTVDVGQLARLRVYLLTYGVLSLFLALYVLPTLVACVTPIPALRVVQSMKDVLITGFMTGDLFVVLPTLIDRCKELLSAAAVSDEQAALPEVIVPAFYNFPHVAKLLSLSFVLFAAWYSETNLRFADYARLVVAGVVSLFGSVNGAIPFLLDLARVPMDTFQLFLATSVVAARVGTVAAVMHMAALALVGTYALTGRLRLSPGRIVRELAVGAGLAAVTVVGLGVAFRAMGAGDYEGDRRAREMGLLRPPGAPAVVRREVPEPLPLPSPGGSSLLGAVRQRGLVRVGYVEGQAPYSFFNARGELVGFDVEMAYTLAGDLGVALEFAPVPRERLAFALEDGRYDLVMGGVYMITRRVGQLDFSPPYLDETLAFVVRDHRRAEFARAEWVRAQKGLRVAAPDLPYFLDVLRREFPDLDVIPVPMRDVQGFLSGQGQPVDALCLTAERGSFLTLLYPAFAVAVPHPLQVRLPLAYPVGRRDLEMTRYLATWIDLKKKDGTIQSLYEHWILGRQAQRPPPAASPPSPAPPVTRAGPATRRRTRARGSPRVRRPGRPP
jgi:Na+/H+-dicarboxylate symporter/ABC-type amino acid transport substrate-binding protein